MKLVKEYAGLVAVVAIVLLIMFGSSNEPAPSFGGANCNGGNCTDYDAVNTSAGYYVDDVLVMDGSGFLSGPSTGSCSLISTNFTVAASTTVSMDCAVSGVISTDIVFGQFATSTTLGNGWAIDGASASSTSGYITFRVTNWTGGSALIPASLASTTKYFVSK